jgi:hypothetical protein
MPVSCLLFRESNKQNHPLAVGWSRFQQTQACFSPVYQASTNSKVEFGGEPSDPEHCQN